MQSRYWLALNLLAAATLVGGLSTPVRADDVHCPLHLGNVTIDGNVLIAAPCELDGTIVKGNVHLYSGGSLVATGVRVNGNIQAERADFVDVTTSTIGGSVQLDELVGDLSVIEGSEIGGSVQLKANRSRLEVLDSEVGADVQAFDNTGGVLILGNVIDGNLQCKSNSPAPVGGSNRVGGNKEDQCANLQPEAGGGAAALTATAVVAATAPVQAESGGGGAMGPFALLLLPLLAWRLRRRRARA
jgi:hypothetical protein